MGTRMTRIKRINADLRVPLRLCGKTNSPQGFQKNTLNREGAEDAKRAHISNEVRNPVLLSPLLNVCHSEQSEEPCILKKQKLCALCVYFLCALCGKIYSPQGLQKKRKHSSSRFFAPSASLR